MKRTTICTMAAGFLCAVAPAIAQTAAQPFKDVPQNHWAYSAVENLRQKGVLRGYPDGNFRGKRTVTRWEAAEALGRTLSEALNHPPMRAEGGTGPQGAKGETGAAGAPGPKGEAPREAEELLRFLSVARLQAEQMNRELRTAEKRTQALEGKVEAAKRK